MKTRSITGNTPTNAGRPPQVPCALAVELAVALAVALAVTALMSGAPGSAEAGTIQASIERRITADSLEAVGLTGSGKALLRGNEPAVGADHRIMVRVTLDPGNSETGGTIVPLVNDAPPAWLGSIPGCCVRGSLGPCVEVRIAPAQVRALAAHPGVMHVGLPPRPAPLAESQGLAGMRVPEFWSRYGRGDGVRVGVLDIGFLNYERLLGSELPAHVEARAFYDEGSGPDITGHGEAHGTACAEIVHDVAPGAELYIANAGTPEELRLAVTWLIEQGVEVISHSIAWPLGGGDGKGPIHDVVRLARENGVIWVNAAGNFAQGYWGGYWSDPDSNRILNVDERGGEAILLPSNVGREVQAWLTWDRWPFSTDLDFVIELMAADGRTVRATSQDGVSDPFAFRALDLLGSSDLAGTTIRVRCLRGDPQGRFLRITRTDGDLAPQSRVPEGSLAMPADSPDAIAVGAYDWADRALEMFSSYGPTLDGRVKPEILGPDGVQNSVRDPFYGTSAACPHVAGAIALLLETGPQGGLFDARPDPGQVTALLHREAGPLALDSPAPAGATGWGCVRLPENRARSAGPRLLALGNGSGSPVLRLERTPRPGLSCEVFDLQGRLVMKLEGASKGNGTVEFAAAPLAELHLVRGRYWAREPVSGARVSFLWPGPSVR
jgi:subtilisin family serine protease